MCRVGGTRENDLKGTDVRHLTIMVKVERSK